MKNKTNKAGFYVESYRWVFTGAETGRWESESQMSAEDRLLKIEMEVLAEYGLVKV